MIGLRNYVKSSNRARYFVTAQQRSSPEPISPPPRIACAQERALHPGYSRRAGGRAASHPSLTACSLRQPRKRAVLLRFAYAPFGVTSAARAVHAAGHDGSEGMTRPDSPKEWTDRH